MLPRASWTAYSTDLQRDCPRRMVSCPLTGAITLQTNHFSSTEEALRHEVANLRQSGIYSVQAVSASMVESTHLSQDFRAFVEELAYRGIISQEVSPESSEGEPVQATPRSPALTWSALRRKGPSPAASALPDPRSRGGNHQPRDSLFAPAVHGALTKSPETVQLRPLDGPSRSRWTPPAKTGEVRRQGSAEEATSTGATTIRDLLN